MKWGLFLASARCCLTFYPAVRSIGRILSLLYFTSYVRLRISQPGLYRSAQKFCMEVRPDLGQVVSHFGGIAAGMAEFWASTWAIWRICFLLKHLFFFCLYFSAPSRDRRVARISFQGNMIETAKVWEGLCPFPENFACFSWKCYILVHFDTPWNNV